jgi:hypothetical protein
MSHLPEPSIAELLQMPWEATAGTTKDFQGSAVPYMGIDTKGGDIVLRVIGHPAEFYEVFRHIADTHNQCLVEVLNVHT